MSVFPPVCLTDRVRGSKERMYLKAHCINKRGRICHSSKQLAFSLCEALVCVLAFEIKRQNGISALKEPVIRGGEGRWNGKNVVLSSIC